MTDYYSGYAASAEPAEALTQLFESNKITIINDDANDIKNLKQKITDLTEELAKYDAQIRDLKSHNSSSNDINEKRNNANINLIHASNKLATAQKLVTNRAKHVNVVRKFHVDMYKLIYDSIREDLKKAKSDLDESIKSGVYTTVIARFNPYDNNLVAYHAYRNEYLTMTGDKNHELAHNYAMECLDKVTHKEVIEDVKKEANKWFENFKNSMYGQVSSKNPSFGVPYEVLTTSIQPPVPMEEVSSTMINPDESFSPYSVPTESIAVGPDEPMRDLVDPNPSKQVRWDPEIDKELPIEGGTESVKHKPGDAIPTVNKTRFNPKYVWALRDLIDAHINARLDSGTIMRKLKESTSISTINTLIERINLIHMMMNDEDDMQPSSNWNGYSGRGKITLNNLEMPRKFDITVYCTLLSYYTLEYLLRITHDIQVDQLQNFAKVDTMKMREPFVDITSKQREIIAVETGIYVNLTLNDNGLSKILDLRIDGINNEEKANIYSTGPPYNRVEIDDNTLSTLSMYFDKFAEALTLPLLNDTFEINNALNTHLDEMDKLINSNGIKYNAKMIKSVITEKYDRSASDVLNLATYKV